MASARVWTVFIFWNFLARSAGRFLDIFLDISFFSWVIPYLSPLVGLYIQARFSGLFLRLESSAAVSVCDATLFNFERKKFKSPADTRSLPKPLDPPLSICKGWTPTDLPIHEMRLQKYLEIESLAWKRVHFSFLLLLVPVISHHISLSLISNSELIVMMYSVINRKYERANNLLQISHIYASFDCHETCWCGLLIVQIRQMSCSNKIHIDYPYSHHELYECVSRLQFHINETGFTVQMSNEYRVFSGSASSLLISNSHEIRVRIYH